MRKLVEHLCLPQTSRASLWSGTVPRTKARNLVFNHWAYLHSPQRSTHTPRTQSTHCNTLQHSATHCNTLPHTATHCHTLQNHGNTLPKHCNTYYIHTWPSDSDCATPPTPPPFTMRDAQATYVTLQQVFRRAFIYLNIQMLVYAYNMNKCTHVIWYM